jgi:chemotaxis protein CheD
MNPLNTDLPVIQLKPGKVHFSERPELVATILGSCVSIIMYSPRLKCASICHSLLPYESQTQKKDKVQNDDFKYLDQAFNTMYKWFLRRGLGNIEIIIKVFGGGEVLQFDGSCAVCSKGSKLKSVGTQNVEAALRLISDNDLKIAALDTGGDSGRKIYFYTHTGEVLLKRIKKTKLTQTASKLNSK